ncbi:MAG: hypothetical protein ACFFG0_00825 [Candidatus Thorarchaeota archaeon]
MLNFRDPCRKCLIRACCTITCNKKYNFNRFKDNVLPTISLAISAVIMFYVISFVNDSKNIIIRSMSFPLIWVVSFIIIIKFLKGKKFIDSSTEYIAFFVLSPFLLIITIIIKIYKFLSELDINILKRA